MNVHEDLKYTKEHEWVKIDGKIATIGITEHAQEQLGDVVFLELPEEGEAVTKGDACGVVESVKAVSDLYTPVSGEVTEINEPLKESPSHINEDCYGDGWMLRVEMSNIDDLDDLLDADQYKAFLAEEAE